MDAADVKVWRRPERARLIALRMGTPSATRQEWNGLITAELAFLADRPGPLGVFWPFRAEFDPANTTEFCVKLRGKEACRGVILNIIWRRFLSGKSRGPSRPADVARLRSASRPSIIPSVWPSGSKSICRTLCGSENTGLFVELGRFLYLRRENKLSTRVDDRLVNVPTVVQCHPGLI